MEFEMGAQADALTNLVFAEALSQSTFGGFIITVLVHTDMASPHLHHAGTPAQKDKYLRQVIAGDLITAVGITEPGAGSDGQPSGIGDGAGGGGGWPGGDHGPTSGTAGIAGGMYLPAPNGSQLDGPTSPPFSYVYGDVRPTPWPPSGVGSVFIWYWPEDVPAGWHVGLGW